ncbi:uncharacterized protein LOC126696012 [Quercus robur]|uniref:uncharacterized protein LOC126696012 n=1 Tax=Quercus robur TaxID=38942 RepID=UPI002161DF62|nr:uncharacterized protein LOC126696012 [Quercus robur]
MRHPADSDAWKMFDSKHLHFSSNPRNVRLGLAVDGFNPFRIMRITIDVYLELLVEKLRELWDVGVQAYDASSKEVFQLRAALMWTINDFPTYADLSGWSTKGELDCPSCAMKTESRYLKNGRKFCYMGHRWWLDVDHDFHKDEKNVMDNILSTLLNLKDKTKDNYKACLDLADMGIRSELHLQRKSDDQYTIPAACFHMTSSEIDGFLQVLKDVTVPDGYASNISRHVNMKECKISGLKSHDNHILMQQLFPIALRGSLPSHVTRPLIKLACFCREICSKTLTVSDIVTSEADIAVTLCELQKIFPPSFFTVMVHLVMHLAAEVKISGPVHYRWMYPIERYLSRLKSYVRNRAAPEGSIAKGYIVEECLTFCSRMHKRLIEDELQKGHNRNVFGAIIYKHHMEKFYTWFRGHVMSLTGADKEKEGVSDTLVALSKWPYIYVKRFKHYCKWVHDQHRRGYRTDEFGFPMVNFTHFIHGGDKMMDKPYVLASQVTQVFYVEDKRHKDWYAIVKTKVRDVFDAGVGPQHEEDDTYSFSENVPYNINTNEVVSDNLRWARDDLEGMTIDASIIAERNLHGVNDEDEFIDDESDNEDDNKDEYTEDE